MGLDEVFVYLVENYHMKGDAYWMDNETLSKYVDRAQKVAPNVLGNLAPELKMTGIDGKPRSMSGVDAKYTLLVFWDPGCGHCQTELPKLDSVYRAGLKNKGVKVFAVKTGGDDDIKQWKDFIEKHKLNDWIHVYDPERKSNYKAQYDVYATPMIYLLDEKKIIRGKKLDHSTLNTLFEIMEKKETAAKSNKK
jgi:peroxiredoxin